MPETIDEMIARHKKEVKSFQGEKLAAIKNAKSRGKKAKTAVKEAEFKYDGLEWDMKERHRMEMDQLSGGGEVVNGDDAAPSQEEAIESTAEISQEEATPSHQPLTSQAEEQPNTTSLNEEEVRRQKALQKKLKKKNQQRQMEIDREKRIEEENSTAGPSRRQLELEAMQTLYLRPRGLAVQEVEADGNCLYRAVAMQCRRLNLDVVDVTSEKCYDKIRTICADVLMGSNRAEYEPFAECGEGYSAAGGGENEHHGNHPATFEEYVNNVRSTSTWGGQLELRALCEGLKCPIVVFSAEGPPLTMGADYAQGGAAEGEMSCDKNNSLLLSFHRHYYALGEHYNSVVPE
ncbi:hypothetical protein ACHAWU_010141 [Discostella pseudostelligera]|uniref:OTU domain-containing protein n=1 Tax=Discostella pseudostelligera TaxID=259834 RepID=A0ABD3MDD6_9STRA